jgi:NAD(P)-dependent dehydrogenase (short-subunit alcohol dehydrogenase family)
VRYRQGVSRVLIIGASRGIGLGLVEVHLKAGWNIHATTRGGSPPVDHADVTTHRLDVRDRDQLETLISNLDDPVDRIIHNAGILRASRSDLMEVNAEAPIRVVEALLDAGRLSHDGIVAIMTSQMGARRGRSGSLGDYGDSKALLNDDFRNRSPEWRDAGAIAVVIHPGWVRTDMGGRRASIGVSESAEGIIRVLDTLTAEDHSKFLTWDGRVHPW